MTITNEDRPRLVQAEGDQNHQERLRTSVSEDTDTIDAQPSNPFDNPKATEKANRERKKREERERAEKRYGSAHYDLADLLTQTTVPTALRAAQAVARQNTRREVKDAPHLFVTGAVLVKADVPAAELAALTPIGDDRVAELQIEAAAQRKATDRAVQHRAAAIESERLASELEMPERVNLAEHVPLPERWIAEGLWRQDATLGLFAERKAGKSTAVRETVRALLDNTAVFGHFPVTFDAADPVVLIDSEMSVDYLHEKYVEAGFTPEMLARLHLYSIRGRERTFDVRSPQIQAWWAERIPTGAVVIFDCLYAVLAALGISENDDTVGAVTLGFRSLVVQSGARGSILVHHLGKDADRGARGHGSIEGGVDSMAYIGLSGPIHDPNTERTLSLAGRIPAFDRHTLVLGDDARYTLENREEKKERKKAEKRETTEQADERVALGIVRAHPGHTKNELESFRGGRIPEKRFRGAVTRLLERGIIEDRGRPGVRCEIHATTKGLGDAFGTPADVVAEAADDVA